MVVVAQLGQEPQHMQHGRGDGYRAVRARVAIVVDLDLLYKVVDAAEVLVGRRPIGQDRLAEPESGVFRRATQLSPGDVGAPTDEVAVAQVTVAEGRVGSRLPTGARFVRVDPKLLVVLQAIRRAIISDVR